MAFFLRKKRALYIVLIGILVFGLINLGLLAYFLFTPESELPLLGFLAGYSSAAQTPTGAKGAPLVKPPVLTVTLPKGKILFEDDFSQVKSGWPRKESSTGIMDYVLDSYHLLVKPPNYMIWANLGKSYGDVIIEVDAQVASEAGGDAGILCRYRSPENFYQMVIANDGYFGIYKIKNNEKSFISMNQMRRSPAINPLNASNHLRAECVGSRLKFYANGQLLAEVFDLEFIVGDVGLSAGSYNLGDVNVEFDNFVLMQP